MKEKLSVYWVRRDLRLKDNPALFQACAHAKETNIPLLPVFVLEDYMCEGSPLFQFGNSQREFLIQAVPPFTSSFESFYLCNGKVTEIFIALNKTFDITLFVNEDIYIDFYTQVARIRDAGMTVVVCADQLTIDKETKTGTGGYYSVFTPFKKAVWSSFLSATETPRSSFSGVSFLTPKRVQALKGYKEPNEATIRSCFSSQRLFTVGTHTLDIDTLITCKTSTQFWYTTETEALAQFKTYLNRYMSDYKNVRDSLEADATSKMSLALTWGLLSARTLKNEIQKYFNDDFSNIFSSRSNEGALHYISELIWREFYKYLLFHKPELMQTEFQEKYRGTIAWADDALAIERFVAWIQGKTGYTVVDAAMMQLAHEGWMHNRARMIVASVLTKNLGVNWRWGQEYFRAMLIDLDEASNNGGWQWGASVGADPKPIRIFNPYLQAQNYDKKGVYQKKWLGIDRYQNQVAPIVLHSDARNQALTRYGLIGGKPIVRDY